MQLQRRDADGGLPPLLVVPDLSGLPRAVTAKGKPPPPEHTLTPLWALLTDRQREEMRTYGASLPEPETPPEMRPALETTEEIDRIMRLRPRLLGQQKERP